MKILLACEFGIGLRHTAHLWQLAQHYLNMGCAISFFHYDPQTLKFVAKDIHPLLDFFPTPTQGFCLKQTPLSNYGDILACLGCADSTLLPLHLTSWKSILKLIKPDLIICENAPVLSLVGRSYAPLICMGDGYSILPFAKDKFPLLRADIAPKIRPDILHERMNGALQTTGLPPLERLGDIWHGYPVFINHLSDLDMYLPHRLESTAMHAPFYDVWEEPDPVESDAFFAYLFADYPNVDSILISFVQNKMRGLVYMPDATQKIVDYLEQNHITVLKTLEKPLAHYLTGKNFIFHHGGMELTQVALAKGIPQIFFPTSLNNLFLANTLKNRGCGESINAYKIGLNQVIEQMKAFVYQSNFRHSSLMEGLKIRERKSETTFQKILNHALQTQERQAA